ncbi:isoniazid inducible gene protein IniC [Acrocarpospora corrugata]|uniref:Isoniazid inducible gene protein IniC n=1 Tax=Acrocarpospora corrugata TaxID=35763 RepID=A0A5M3VWV9_9ACTN|nr:GTPase [Acrocarpospora corrugata]GES01337.1 isoniazid inducible gene protein IniC [Acrocarpospora corrugata]
MLRDRADAAFNTARTVLARVPTLAPAAEAVAAAHDRLASALRVALVGRVGSGKSTLANALLGRVGSGEFTLADGRVGSGQSAVADALLGERSAATRVQELAVKVTWLRHGLPALTAHFTDGRPPEARDLAELERLVVRADGAEGLAGFLRGIDYLEVADPNPYLRAFDLVDTPGLDTPFGAETIARFPGRTSAGVRAASLEHAGRADAIVLVLAPGLAAAEEELLEDFTAAGFSTATPITTIGALTKIDLFWPEHADPMAEGERVAARLMHAAGARRYLYDLRPLATQVGVAADTFGENDFADLTTLSQIEPDTLTAKLRHGPMHPDLGVPPERGQALFALFGGYGIALACALIRNGIDSIPELRTELLNRSGLTAFRTLLTDHFGNRADLIKLSRAIQDVRRLPALAGPTGPRERMALDQAIAAITQLEFQEHALAEFAVLRNHYDGLLTFNGPQVAELLRLTGQHGLRLTDRLDLDPAADPTTQAAKAHERLIYWAGVDIDPSCRGATRRAAQVIRQSYELIINDL